MEKENKQANDKRNINDQPWSFMWTDAQSHS